MAVKFSKDICNKICEHIADGKSLRSVCEKKDMPSVTAVNKWLLDEDKAIFVAQYTRAREAQADHYADEVVEIADTEPDPQKAKVRIDARKWSAGKMRPKKYGDKSQVELSGPDGGPVQVVERVIVKAKN